LLSPFARARVSLLLSGSGKGSVDRSFQQEKLALISSKIKGRKKNE